MRYSILTTVFLFSFLIKSGAQKQVIDTELLSEIIVAKQDELKRRLLSDIVVRNVQTTNYATYNTLYYLVNSLVEEKNKTIMTQSIVKELGRYVTAHLAAKYVIDNALKGKLYSAYKAQEVPEKVLVENMKTIKTRETQGYISEIDKEDILKMASNFRTKKSDSISAKLDNAISAKFYSYAIDTLYFELYKNEILSGVGLFDKSVNERFIKYGLEDGYPKIYDELRINFKDEHKSIKDAINNLLSITTSTIGNTNGEFKSILDTLINCNFSKYPKSTQKKLAFDVSKLTLSYILKRFDSAMSVYKNDIGKGAIVAKLGGIISNYVILDLDSGNIYDFKIDVEAIILALEEEFLNFSIVDIRKHKIGVKPFFNIGFSYGYFLDKSNSLVPIDVDNSLALNQISLASERLGLKFIFVDQKYSRSQKPNEWYQYRGRYRRWSVPPKKTIVNNIYGMVYASGILYNIVDVKSEDTFKYPIIGAGLGIAFFNDLELNISLGLPIQVQNDKPLDAKNTFVSIGFDVPIFEYLKAAKRKS